MQNILLLSRLAFICNIFFLISVSLLYSNWIGDEGLTSTVVVLGLLISFIINPLSNLINLGLKLWKKPLFIQIPAWLVWVNFIFLLLQITYFIYRNVTSYYP